MLFVFVALKGRGRVLIIEPEPENQGAVCHIQMDFFGSLPFSYLSPGLSHCTRPGKTPTHTYTLFLIQIKQIKYYSSICELWRCWYAILLPFDRTKLIICPYLQLSYSFKVTYGFGGLVSAIQNIISC